jgi:hypothetical protein
MMKVIKKIILGLLAIVALCFFLPGITRIERSADIAAPAQAVFEQINELKNWKNWSSWQQVDPNVVMQYSDPSSAGVGAFYTWASEKRDLGKGKLTILDAKPLENVHCRIDFESMSGSISDFKLIAKDSLNTQVKWTFESEHGLNPLSRWVGIFMDKMVGPDYEKSLMQMKLFCEKK